MKELVRGRTYVRHITFSDIEEVQFVKMVNDDIGALVRPRFLFFFWGSPKLVRAADLIAEWPS